MKKWILLTPLLMITIDLSAQPQDIVVHLARNKKTTITTEQLGSLKSKSGTIRNMFEDIPDESDELHLPDVERSSFRLLMEVHNRTGEGLRGELKKLHEKKVQDLMQTANYLATEELLDASSEEFAEHVFGDNHTEQLLTKPSRDTYYQNLGLLAELQGKVAQQFVKTKIALSLKKLAKQPCLTFKPDKFDRLAVFDRYQAGRHLVAGIENFSSEEVRTFIEDELRKFRSNDYSIKDRIMSVAFDLKFNYFAILSLGHSIRVLDIKTKEQLRQFDDVGGVASIAINPAGKQLAIGYCNKKVHILDIKTAEKLLEFKLEGYVNLVAFDQTGNCLVTGTIDYGVQIFNLKTGERLKQFDHDDRVDSVAIDSTGKYLAMRTRISSSKNRICIFDVETKKELHRFDYDGLSTSLLFDPTSNYLATGFDPIGNYFDTGSADDKPLIWIVMPVFEKTLQELTLPEAQLVALVTKKKIQPNAVPEHLENLYKSLPETVRYLLEA